MEKTYVNCGAFNLHELLLPYQRKFVDSKKKRKIWLSSRQIGKSFSIAYMLVQKALSRRNGLSLCVSTGMRSAEEIIKKCAQFAEAIKILSDGRLKYTASFDQIKWENGSRVVSLPTSIDGANLRGFSAQCVCLDEAAFIKWGDAIMQSIAPTLTRDPDAELVLTSTPAGKNGLFYELYEKAVSDKDWYVQTTTIHDAIADGLKLDLDSIKSLCQDPDVFAQEYECVFASEYSSMLDPSLLDWYDDLPEEKGTAYFGMDIGRRNDKSCIADGRLIKGKLYVDDLTFMDNMEYSDQYEVLKYRNRENRYSAGYIDMTGIGSAFAERVQKEMNSRFRGVQWNGQNKTPAYELLRQRVYEHKILFNRKLKDKIEDEIRMVQRIITPEGKVKFQAGRDARGHADAVSAIVHLLKCSHDNPPSFGSPTSWIAGSVF